MQRKGSKKPLLGEPKAAFSESLEGTDRKGIAFNLSWTKIQKEIPLSQKKKTLLDVNLVNIQSLT